MFFDVVDKGCTRKDLKIKVANKKFYDEHPELHLDTSELKPITLSGPLFDFANKISLGSSTPTIDASNFIDTELDCDYDKLNICEYYFDKKILPTPALENFISCHFSTPEQLTNKWALIAAWFAIGISLLMSAFSIYSTYKVDPSGSNLEKIQTQLDSIENNTNNSTKNQLSEITTELKNISKSESANSHFDDKLDKLISLIQDYIDNLEK